MTGEELAPICREVFERAVEGRDVMSDAALAAHVGSCVTCFRTVSEMRDATRIAAALRAGAPAPEVSDGFWDDLAARTTGAAAAALRQPARRRAARAVIGFASLAVAAAAAVLLVAGQTPTGTREGATRTHAVATTAAGPEDESASDDAVDVADLDESALRRLLDRLSARAPRHVPALATIGDAREAADAAFDDEGQMNDELAELDAPALLRIERSLAGARL
jgi:hypothetical protein